MAIDDKIKIAYDNKLRDATLYWSSQNSTYTVANLLQGRLTAVWKTGGYFTITTLNNKLYFKDVAATLTATLTVGTYTASTLCTEIDTQLEATGCSNYTVTYLATTGKFTLASDISGGATLFSLMFDSTYYSVASVIGFLTTEDKTGAVTYTSDNVALHTEEFLRVALVDGTTTINALLLENFNLSSEALITIEGDNSLNLIDPITANHLFYSDFKNGLTDVSIAGNNLSWGVAGGYVALPRINFAALHLNGGTEYATLADVSASDFEFHTGAAGVDFSIEIQIKVDSLSLAEPIMSKWHVANTKGWKLEKLVNDHIKFTISDGANIQTITTTSSVDTNVAYTWIGVTCDWGGNLNLYINGVVAAAPASMATVVGDCTNTADFLLGKLAATYFSGYISYLKITEGELTATQILDNTNHPIYTASYAVPVDSDGDLRTRLYMFPQQALQYWKIIIQDPKNSDLYCQVGKVFIGDYLEFNLDSTTKATYSMGDTISTKFNTGLAYSDKRNLAAINEAELTKPLSFTIPFSIDRDHLEKIESVWAQYPFMWLLMLALTNPYGRTYYALMTDFSTSSVGSLDYHELKFGFEVIH